MDGMTKISTQNEIESWEKLIDNYKEKPYDELNEFIENKRNIINNKDSLQKTLLFTLFEILQNPTTSVKFKEIIEKIIKYLINIGINTDKTFNQFNGKTIDIEINPPPEISGGNMDLTSLSLNSMAPNMYGGNMDLTSLSLNSIAPNMYGRNMDLTSLSLNSANPNNYQNNSSIGNTLNSIVNRIVSGGRKSSSSSSKMRGQRLLNFNTEADNDSSDNSDTGLKKIVKSQKNELVEKLFKIIGELLESKTITDKTGKHIKNNEKNVKLIKSFLYTKAKEAKPDSFSAEKFNWLLSKSSTELENMIKDLPDIDKLEKDIEEHMKQKSLSSENTSVSSRKSSNKSDSSLNITDLKPKKKVVKSKAKSTKSKSKK